MSKTIDMTPARFAEMERELAATQGQLAKLEQQKKAGISVIYASGVTEGKEGKPDRTWQNISITGGALGSWGFKTTPAKHAAYMSAVEQIDEVIKEHGHRFAK